MIRPLFAASLVLLSLSVTVADEVKILGGKSADGTLQKISEKEIVIDSAGKSVATPLSQVLEVTIRSPRGVPAGVKYIEVRLVDDSFLRCTKVAFGAKETTLELTSGGTVKVPTTAIVTLLRDADDANIKKQWDRLLKDKKNVDRIFLFKAGDLNPLTGILGAINETKQSIKFKPNDVPEIEPSLEKLQGLQFTRTDVPNEASLCKVYDLDGNLLVASKLTYDAGGAMQITTPFGNKVALDYKVAARLDFNFGRLTYLSDLDAKMSDSIFLGGFNPMRKDANLDGGPIMVLDKKYDKGLSVYAGTDLEYNLGGKFKDFKATLGVDARIAEEGQGNVTVTIYADKAKLAEHVVSSKAAIPIALNVKDASTLRIIVSGTNITGYSGHATLANAHVSQ